MAKFQNPWGNGGAHFPSHVKDGVGLWFNNGGGSEANPATTEELQQVAAPKSFNVIFGQSNPAIPNSPGPTTLTTIQAQLLNKLATVLSNLGSSVLLTKIKGTSSSAYLPSFNPSGPSLISALNEANFRALAVAAVIGFPVDGLVDPDATNVVNPQTDAINKAVADGMSLDPIISLLKNSGGYINNDTNDSATVSLLYNQGAPRKLVNEANKLADAISTTLPY